MAVIDRKPSRSPLLSGVVVAGLVLLAVVLAVALWMTWNRNDGMGRESSPDGYPRVETPGKTTTAPAG